MRLPSFVFRNLRRHAKSFAFSIVGIVLGVATGLIFWGLGHGMQVHVIDKIFVQDQVEVVPKRYDTGQISFGSLFGNSVLNDRLADDLLEVPGVRAVYPKMQISFPTVAWLGAELFGRELYTELFADGIPAGLIAAELPPPEQIFDEFRDWDLAAIACDQPGSEGQGIQVGCPPGQGCNSDGICEKLYCVPAEEVFASHDRNEAQAAAALLNTRLRHRRYRRVEVREADPETLPEGSPIFRVAVNRSFTDEARRHLTPMTARSAAEHRVGDAIRASNTALREARWGGGEPDDEEAPEPSGQTPAPPDVGAPDAPPSTGDPELILGYTHQCRDAPAYCPADTRRCELPIPIVASPVMLELYNNQVQNVLSGSESSMPSLTEQALLGFQFQVEFGRGILGESLNLENVGSRRRQLRLVGWSPRAIRLGVTMPLSYVQRLNGLYKGEDAAGEYHSLLVVAEHTDRLGRIVNHIEQDLGLGIGPEYEQAKRWSLVIELVTKGLLFISGLILIVAALNIMHTFLMVVAERRREIGVLRAVGARRKHVLLLILAEAAVVGVLGAGLGIAVALGVAHIANERFQDGVPDFLFRPDELFVFEGWMFGAAIGIAVVFSILGALGPAFRASRMDPADAVRER